MILCPKCGAYYSVDQREPECPHGFVVGERGGKHVPLEPYDDLCRRALAGEVTQCQQPEGTGNGDRAE